MKVFDGVGLLREEVRVREPVFGVQWVEGPGLGLGPSQGLVTMPAPSPAVKDGDEAGEGEEGGNEADEEEGQKTTREPSSASRSPNQPSCP